MDSINRLSLKLFGKHFVDLNEEERQEIKRHPLWHSSVYSQPSTDFTEAIRKEQE